MISVLRPLDAAAAAIGVPYIVFPGNVGDDQALDRRIGGYLQRAVESWCREEHESSRDPASHAQYAKKDLGERGRGRHIHARNSGPFERAGTARRGMIA